MRFASTVLFVDDVPVVLEFYKKAFGFETKFYDPDFQFGEIEAGGVSLGIGSHECGERMMPGAYRKPPRGRPEGVEIAFFTEEVSTAYHKAVEAGAEPVLAPKQMAWGQTVAYVRSLEGTIVGICTPIDQ